MKNLRTPVILLAIFLAMAAFYLFVVRGKHHASVDAEESAFAIRDTAAVQAVTLTLYENDNETQRLKLERTPAGWRVNETASANPIYVQQLLQTLRDMEMRQPANAQLSQTIFKQFGQRKILVEVEMEPGEDKSFIVGGHYVDNKGTYMMMRNSNHPYLVTITGFEGYLTPRFEPVLKNYAENILFNVPAAQLKSVSVQHVLPDTSFALSRTSATAPFQLASGEPVDTARLGIYLRSFGKVYCFGDAAENRIQRNAADSLRRLDPYIRFTVEDFKNHRTRINLYKRADDTEYWLALIDGDNTVKDVQWAVAAKFFPPRQWFVKTGK